MYLTRKCLIEIKNLLYKTAAVAHYTEFQTIKHKTDHSINNENSENSEYPLRLTRRATRRLTKYKMDKANKIMENKIITSETQKVKLSTNN